MNLSKYFLLMFSGAIALLVSGCSGGGASTTNNVTGVAATGAAINGTVCLQDAAIHEVCMKTADGHYSFDVTGLTPPFILKASWNDNGITKELYSMAAGKGVANISPLTNAIVTVAATVAPATLYATPTLTAMQAAASNLSAATTKIITSLAPLLQEFAVSTDVNPITTTYNVNHAGLDGFLDLSLIHI